MDHHPLILGWFLIVAKGELVGLDGMPLLETF
jgi:hypothetical protein